MNQSHKPGEDANRQQIDRRTVIGRAAKLSYQAPLLLGAVKLAEEKAFGLSRSSRTGALNNFTPPGPPNGLPPGPPNGLPPGPPNGLPPGPPNGLPNGR